jgi:hypothetical protein
MTDSPSNAPTLTYAAVALTLELSRLRSSLLVGLAMARKCPTEDAWTAMIEDPDYIESMNGVAEVFADIRKDYEFGDHQTPEAVTDVAERHYGRAVESVEYVAELLEVPTEDFLAVLVSL